MTKILHHRTSASEMAVGFFFFFFQQLNKCFVCYWEILSQFEMPYTVKWEF